MSHAYGIDWKPTHGTAAFQYGAVIADIAKLLKEKGYGCKAWVNNVRGHAHLATQKSEKTYAFVIYEQSGTSDPTPEEIALMEEENLPMLKVAFPSGLFALHYPVSFQSALPFEGRQWVPNFADCYRLLLDYYKTVFSITLPVVVTPENYVAQSRSYAGQNLFLTNWQMSGFKQVMFPQDGDLIYMRTGNPAVLGPDHCGIYLDGDKILHHFINRLSTVQEYAGLWKEKTVMVLRHQERI